MKTFKQFMEQVVKIAPLAPFKTIPANPNKPSGTKTLVDPVTGMKPSGQPYPYKGASAIKKPISSNMV